MPSSDAPEGTCWTPFGAPHQAGTRIAMAFAKKSGWRVVSAAFSQRPQPLPRNNLFYGVLHGGESLFHRCKAEGAAFLHVDHGYFRRSHSPQELDGFLRFTRDDVQKAFGDLPSPSERAKERFARLGVALGKYREGNSHVVIVPPTTHQTRFLKLIPVEDWIKAWSDNLEAEFGLPIIVSTKTNPAFAYFEGARLVCGFNSTTLIDAAAKGIPVRATGHSPLTVLRDKTGEEWEQARYDLFCELSEHQFNMEEIEGGVAYAILKEKGVIQ
jgi:hypothetical protein